MRALLPFNAAALVLRSTSLALHEQADVPECYPFKGRYETGCEYMENMCELSSYTDDPSNPSWCTKYAHDVLKAFTDCERDVRLNATEPFQHVGLDGLPAQDTKDVHFGPNFVRCYEGKMPEPPDCSGMCALHQGACQILCANAVECTALCSGEGPASNPDLAGPAPTDRHDILDCVNDCLLTKPTPPPATRDWPSTVNASYPPETAGNQAAMKAAKADLAVKQAEYAAEQVKLEAAREAQAALKAQLRELLKMKLGLKPVPTEPTTPAPPPVAPPAPAAAEAPVAPTEPPTTQAPVPVSAEDAVASSPIAESAKAMEEQKAETQAMTASVEADTQAMQAEINELRAQLGLAPLSDAEPLMPASDDSAAEAAVALVHHWGEAPPRGERA